MEKFGNNKNPNISIISPVFNREKYISRFIKSIQNQNFYNIEIILVDDNSLDNSVNKIEIFKKEDKRILLIKNKKNKGTFISRNLGVLYSKGKYIILSDPDDIISKNILNICFKYAEKYKYELIRFDVYTGKGNLLYDQLYKKLEKRPIYQPKLSLYLFYGTGNLQRIDGIIYNKFIKREAFIRALNILKHIYLNMYMIYQEDVIITFSLYIASKSFLYLNEIGYFYIINTNSINNNLLDILRLKSFLIQLKFVFDYYKNTKYERDIINLILNNFIQNFCIKKFMKTNLYIFKNELNNYYDILNIYFDCIFISRENRKVLKNFKKIIEKKYKKKS
jgi:glycosyltransferase involved in cell wall biosynthesis